MRIQSDITLSFTVNQLGLIGRLCDINRPFSDTIEVLPRYYRDAILNYKQGEI